MCISNLGARMDRKDFDAWEIRVRDRADEMWAAAGHPTGGPDRYIDSARDIVAMGEVALPTLDPAEAAEPMIEEASLQANLGEFPTLRDQGDEQLFPRSQEEVEHSFDRISGSDGDASDTGGVLPEADEPQTDGPDVSLAHGDITTSSVNAGDDPLNDDLNDDGMPDPTDLDADDEDDDEDEDEDDQDDDAPDEDGEDVQPDPLTPPGRN